MFEIILPRRALPQPKPFIVKGGDCAGCAFAGLLGWESVQQVYDEVGDVQNWFNARSAIVQLVHDGHLDHAVWDTPTWPKESWAMPWGCPSWEVAGQWWDYLRIGAAGGYYGIASVRHDRSGPLTHTDHSVLICGIRSRWEPTKLEGGKREIQEILVSCSSVSTPDEEWVEAEEFLKYRGGYNVALAKPVG